MILSDAVMDWLESFLVREGLSSATANEFRTVLLRAVILRGFGDTGTEPFLDFFMEHQSEMNEWQIHFLSDIASIMYRIGRIHDESIDQKLIELRKTLALILERSFKLQNATGIALLVLEIARSKSPESEALAKRRLADTLNKEKTPGSQLYGTKRILRMVTELAMEVGREQTSLNEPED
jgi:hypothetical protein